MHVAAEQVVSNSVMIYKIGNEYVAEWIVDINPIYTQIAEAKCIEDEIEMREVWI